MSSKIQNIATMMGAKSLRPSIAKAKMTRPTTKLTSLRWNDYRTFATVSDAPKVDRYWQGVKAYEDVSEDMFLSYRWQKFNTIDRPNKLHKFLNNVVPESVPGFEGSGNIVTREQFLEDVILGADRAPMSTRLTPHILAIANWTDPYNDPIRRQFLTLGSNLVADHPKLELDSLHEADDSPVNGLVHRYPDKVLFLATQVCPLYCRFCTRSYAVGAQTETVTKASIKPTEKRWNEMFEYIEKTPQIQDVVVSGGDSYYLEPHQLKKIGERLLSIPHIRRFRFATKGLAASPMRIIDDSDGWTQAFVDISNQGKRMGKEVSMHTHFNHPNEITWITEKAAQYLFENGVKVRNQTVLLRGVNDDVSTMSTLIRKLADNNMQPYYVYQGDMVKGVEDLRTPLSTILHLQKHIRGTIGGMVMPNFVVDLPGGGGKRLAADYETYDRETGVSTWKAEGVTGDKVHEYYDPKAVVRGD